MKIITEDFKRSLDIVSKGLEKKPILPILNHIVLTKSENLMQLRTTNLERFITTEVNVENDGNEFDIAVIGDELVKIIGTIKDDEIDFSLKDDKVVIKAGKKKFSLSTMNTDEFPKEAIVDDLIYSTEDKAELIDKLRRVPFYSADNTKTILTGVVFSQDEVAATDGYSMGVMGIDGFGGNMQIVSGITLNDILTALSKSSGIDLSIYCSDRNVKFKSGETEITTRIIEGKYPDYKRILPKQFQRELTVDLNELLDSVKQAMIVGEKTTNLVTIEFQPSEMIVYAGSFHGDFESRLSMHGELDSPEKISFNGKLLLTVLKSLIGENVTIKSNSNVQPVVFEGDLCDEHTVMLMPIKP